MKFFIVTGTLFQVPIYAIHNDPDYYPNPDAYNPDRFSPEETAKRHSFAFIPFGKFNLQKSKLL